MTIFQFALIRSLRKKSTLVALFIVPLIMVFIRPLWVLETGTGFLFYGLILLFAAFSLVRLIMTDRVTGTAVRIFAAPITTRQYLSQNLLAFWMITSIQTVVLVVIGAVLYKWEIEMAVWLFLSYSIFSATCIVFSMAWNSLFRSKIMSDAVFSIVISFMGMLGGIFIPLPMLPEVLRKIGMLFPTYWFTNSLLALQEGIMGEYWLSIFIMVLFSIVFLLYGSKRRFE